MSLQWDESMALGIAEIDAQHQAIVEHFSRLSEAAQSGAGKELLEELTQFLVAYAGEHFTTEDQLMVKWLYPNIEEHRAEHKCFTLDAESFRDKVEAEGASRELAITITGKLIRWIIQHIKKDDREMVAFLLDRMATE
jgi:hemerythrin-like metal-binding protein